MPTLTNTSSQLLLSSDLFELNSESSGLQFICIFLYSFILENAISNSQFTVCATGNIQIDANEPLRNIMCNSNKLFFFLKINYHNY